MAKPLYVAVSTQKGGAGKTTLTAILASYFYYIRKVDLAVVDCDYPQWSLAQLRERDLRLSEKSEKIKKVVHETWKARGLSAYEIVKSSPEDALEYAEMMSEWDIVPSIIFFDLPGTVNNAHVINLLKRMDYIFCPMTTDPLVFETSLTFANNIQNKFISTGQSGNIKGLYMLWNRVTSRERNKLQSIMEDFISKLGISVLETALPDSSKFRKEGTADRRFSVFRSTILPPDRSMLKGSGIDELATEISGIIGI